MKKSLLVMLLAVLFAVPALASDTNLELIPKIGYLFSPEISTKINGKTTTSSDDSAFSLGADLFFDMQNNFFLGFGIMWGNNVKFNKDYDFKIGFTNIYVSAKYKILANNKEADPLFVYPLVQFGLGVPSWDVTLVGADDFNMDAGFYWGVGAGVEFKNIILEAIYGCDYANYSYKVLGDKVKEDVTCTAFRINVGYKFNL